MTRRELGRYGVWLGKQAATPDLAAATEGYGFGTMWIGSSPAGDLHDIEPLLGATDHLVLATGIVNIWASDAHETASAFHRLDDKYPGRLLLGVGTGHREATREYEKPFDAISHFVDVLDADGVPADGMILAALGPKVLQLAAERTSGAHPYLVPAEHTRIAREAIGPDRLLAPEHKVVLDPDPQRARTLGRSRVEKPYLGLVNYVNNLKRLGWSNDDVAPPGSDALIDAVVAHGDDATVKAAVDAHLDAGADHVCIQLITADDDLTGGYERLAAALDV